MRAIQYPTGTALQSRGRTYLRLSATLRKCISISARSLTGIALLSTTFIATALGYPVSGPLDLVILVENTAAVKAADPDRKLREVLADFIRASTSETRIAIISYDDLAFPIAPLKQMTTARRGNLLDSLRNLDFDAPGSNLSAGLERAIYEFARNGQDNAARLILMVQSGEISTGDFEQDQAFRKWATDVLAKKAEQMSIRVHALSFGQSADVELARDIAEITGGDHMQAVSSGALLTRFDQLRSRLFGGVSSDKPAAVALQSFPEVQAVHSTGLGTTQAPSAKEESGVVAETPELDTHAVIALVNRLNQTAPPQAGAGVTQAAVRAEGLQTVDDPDFGGKTVDTGQIPRVPAITSGYEPSVERLAAQADKGSLLLWLVIAVLSAGLVAALAAFFTTRQRNKQLSQRDTQVGESSEAQLVDLSGISGQSVYSITGKLVRVCRTPGRDSYNVVCLTIPDDVISREHAYIEYREGDYFVTDRESDNGTYVNGQRVQGTRKLKAGDRIQFATFEFAFEYPAASTADHTAQVTTENTILASVTDATIFSSEATTPSGGLTLVHGSKGRHEATDRNPARTDSTNTNKVDLSDRTVVR